MVPYRVPSVRSSAHANPPGIIYMLWRVIQRPSRSRPLAAQINDRCFTVLALESSADDTCAAVVNSNREIVSNVVVKQYS